MRRDTETVAVASVALVGVAAGVSFLLGTWATELVGEFGSDVDMKPFFIPYLLLAVFPFGRLIWATSVGSAVGEGVLDLFEGYELDEPFGFVGYIIGFLVFAWLLHEVAPQPADRRWQIGAALAGALVQATFEGLAFLLIEDLPFSTALVSVLGNTVTHGLLLGALPLIVLYPVVLDRFGTDPVNRLR